MALTPMDIKSMIPKTQELSNLENNKSQVERQSKMVIEKKQEQNTKRELTTVKQSEKSQGEKIKREEKNKDQSSSEKDERERPKGEVENEAKGLNVSVSQEKIKLGKKLDIKI